MVTIQQVARRAGVGVGTVSRVLNDSPNVSGATRDRVRRAIADLDYRPSHVARSLSLGRTQMVGVLVPFVTHRSAMERIRGMIDRLSAEPYDLVLFDVESPARRDELFASITDRSRLDGVVIVSIPPTDAEVGRFARAGMPVVLVDTRHPRLPHVVVDDVGGGALATTHLLELGHRRIGYIGDRPDEHFGFRAALDRLEGYRAAMRDARLPTDGLIRQIAFDEQAARTTAIDLLSADDPPTAIFATADSLALGVLDAAEHLRLRVPDDVSIVGYDDVDIARYARLTTVNQPLEETGRRGVEQLLRMLDGRDVGPTSHGLDVELVVRTTTGAAPAPSPDRAAGPRASTPP